MKKNRILFALLLVVTMVFFTGCQDNNTEDTPNKGDTQETQQPEKPIDDDEDDQDDLDEDKGKETVTLYIGYQGNKYKEINVKMDREDIYSNDFDEELLDAIEDETNWDLDLAKPIEEIDGGKVISFSNESTFAVGAPKNQKDEYHAMDQMSLGQLILDSIQKTFDMNLTDGNPQRSLNLYFNLMDKPIKLDNLTIPMDKPWNEARNIAFN